MRCSLKRRRLPVGQQGHRRPHPRLEHQVGLSAHGLCHDGHVLRAIAEQAKPGQIKTFAADSNNQWSDQDYAAARTTGDARRLSEGLPATDTLASIAQALAGGGDQWIDLFQAYHRLLHYFEHTNAKDNPRGNMAWYETELEENREMVAEAAEYQRRVFAGASRRLASVIVRNGEKNLIVFNPLPYSRTDIVPPAASGRQRRGRRDPREDRGATVA